MEAIYIVLEMRIVTSKKAVYLHTDDNLKTPIYCRTDDCQLGDTVFSATIVKTFIIFIFWN